MIEERKKPLLLAPAGSYDALCAAIAGGADEVYFGAAMFNARKGAVNFDGEEFDRAIKLCRVCGVRSHITVNTLLFDRELSDALELVYHAACVGADAFIVQDMALALLIRESMPEVVLHASTQCACHNRDGALRLYDAGFSRIVLARELPLGDIRAITENAPYETEIFGHGALCVCHSGQCLFSAAVGGRSGNRGMCAQPCRMVYTLRGGNGTNAVSDYALSLKDLSLACHIKELLTSGVRSLKIEGRMKSPAYVYGVTKLYATLLTEERDADPGEIEELAALFSRGGFTDGYFTGAYRRDNRTMYGVRSDADKEKTRKAEEAIRFPTPKAPIAAAASFKKGERPSVTFYTTDYTVSASAIAENVLEEAKSSSASADSICKNLLKLGDTPFSLDRELCDLSFDADAFVPASVINNLRREAAEKLYAALTEAKTITRNPSDFAPSRREPGETSVSYRVYLRNLSHLSEALSLYMPLESVVLPLRFWQEMTEKDAASLKGTASSNAGIRFGVSFPRVLFEAEVPVAEETLRLAKEQGASFCEVSNIGHIDVVRRAGLPVYGGIGLNIVNSRAADYYRSLGLSSLVLSPECKLGAVRDIEKHADTTYALFVRGRLPLMVLESCILASRGLCRRKASVCGELTDRIGARFPVMASPRLDGGFPCRNLIYNAVMTDLLHKNELTSVGVSVLCVSGEEDGYPM